MRTWITTRPSMACARVLAEPAVSFIVVPVQAETHLVRDFDGAIRVERGRACMCRDFGIDLV